MSREDPRPPPDLPDDLRALLDAERDRPTIDRAAAADLRRRAELAWMQIPAPPPVHRWPLALAGFAAGVLAGALGHALLVPQRAPTVIERVRREVVTVVVHDDAGTAPLTQDAALAPRSPAPPSRREEDTSRAERTTLDRGRVALLRHDPQGALDAVAEHQRRFARGRLIEEREALRIQALFAAGRASEARARTEDFARRWPGSIFIPALRGLGAR